MQDVGVKSDRLPTWILRGKLINGVIPFHIAMEICIPRTRGVATAEGSEESVDWRLVNGGPVTKHGPNTCTTQDGDLSMVAQSPSMVLTHA